MFLEIMLQKDSHKKKTRAVEFELQLGAAITGLHIEIGLSCGRERRLLQRE